MRKSVLNNSKGSAMIMVIAVMVILSTLGIAVLSLSITSFRVSKQDKETQMEFYMAESGLEQAYEVAVDTIKEAAAFASDAVNTEITDFLEAERTKVANGETSNFIVGDSNGSINEEYLKSVLSNAVADPEDAEKYQEWLTLYKDRYKLYLNNNLVTELADSNNYHVVDDSVSSEKPVIDLNDAPTSLFNTGDEPCDLEVQSKLNNTNSEKVGITFEIKVPSELPDTVLVSNDVVVTEVEEEVVTEPVTLDDSPLWDYAVATSARIICLGYTRLNINGNAYAYDNFYIMHKDNKINVTGDLCGYKIHFDGVPEGKAAENCTLTVDGNTYTDSFAMQQNTINNKLNINGSAYATGKIYLQAAQSEINISDTWYQNNNYSFEKVFVHNLCPDYGVAGGSIFNWLHKPSYVQSIYLYNLMRKWQFSYPFENVDVSTRMSNYIDFNKVSYPASTPTYIVEENNEEILCINKDISKNVHLVGPHRCAANPGGPNDIVFELDPDNPVVKGLIVTKGKVYIHGTVNFTGLIVSTESNIYSQHDWVAYSNAGKIDAIKTLTANRSYIQNKVYELELAGRNPFEYTFPAVSESHVYRNSINNLIPWTPKQDIVITPAGTSTSTTTATSTTSRVGIVQAAGLAQYKELISISDWQKL